MKRLVLCFDGTWNAVVNPKTVTNVVRLANLVAVSDENGINQITYYNSGVGSGGRIDRFLGGAFGTGLKANVKRGLAFLALNYNKGDEIYLFGFSRGGYTARAVAGVLGTAGIPLDISETEEHWIHYQQIAKLRDKRGRYVNNSPKRAPYDAQIKALEAELAKITAYEGSELPIRCVGVWDTVGAYGIHRASPTVYSRKSSPTGPAGSVTPALVIRCSLACTRWPLTRCASPSSQPFGPGGWIVT